MVCRVTTLPFEGVDAQPVDVQVQMTGGQPAFHIVGLPDKAVGESRERVRAAFASLGLALPPKRVIVNLAPAHLPKEGSHYDLAIALALLAMMGVIPADQLEPLCWPMPLAAATEHQGLQPGAQSGTHHCGS